MVKNKGFGTYLINFLALISFPLSYYYYFIKEPRDVFLAVTYLMFAPLLVFLPRYFYYKKWHKKYTFSLLKTLEYFVAIFYITAALGGLGLFHIDIEYDSFIHFSNSILVAVLVVFFAADRQPGGLSQNWSNQKIKTAFIAFVGTFLISIIWELYEWGTDLALGTKLLFDPFQTTWDDTFWDVVFGTLGGLLGSLFIYSKWPQIERKWLKKNR